MSLPEFKGQLKPISRAIESLVEAGEKVDTSLERVVRVSHRPHFGEQAYAITLHAAVDEQTITSYEKLHSLEIPEAYRALLTQLGGADIFGLALYGIPLSMAAEPPSLTPGRVQPLDLVTSDRQWRAPFAPKKREIYIGGSYWTLLKVAGYFMGRDGKVRALVQGGDCVGRWPTLRKFLESELERCRRFYANVEKTQKLMLPRKSG